MRKYIGLVLGMVVGCLGSELAYAAPEAVLNDPPVTVSVVKELINKLQPSYEGVLDVYNGGFSQGVSGALYTFQSKGFPLGSIRVGATTGLAVYAGPSLDLPGIARRLLPDDDVQVQTTSETLWSTIGKYARVGAGVGWSWDHDDPVVVLTAGAALTF